MEPLLKLTDFMFDNHPVPLNISVFKGMRICFVTTGEHESRELMKVLTGFRSPDSGSIFLSGVDLSDMSRQQLLDARVEMGIVQASGGLIANLKLWENITLPFMFRFGELSAATGENALRYLELFGYKGNLMTLPGHLSLFEQRMTSFIRAAIGTPQMMLYAGCFDGLSDNELDTFLEISTEFHSKRPELISIYLTADTNIEKGLAPDLTINLRQETATSRRSQ